MMVVMINRKRMKKRGGEKILKRFVMNYNAEKYAMHSLVWTTLKPLISLLSCETFIEVRLFGCFLITVLSRSNNETSKLFQEGAVSALKLILTSSPHSSLPLSFSAIDNYDIEEEEFSADYMQYLAKKALSNLHIDIPPSPSSSSIMK